jgi:subtilisin
LDNKDFVSMLKEEIRLSKQSDKKHIIRFNSKRDYDACISYMKTVLQSPESDCIQDLKIINAISCSLRPGTPLIEAPQVKSIEVDTKISIHAGIVPQQPGNSSGKMKLYNGSQIVPWGVNHIKAPHAWKRSLGSRIQIGVIDTGVDPTHPDLKLSIYRGVNLLALGALPMDDNGHGTHIAGIIAASSSRQGILGVAPLASIHAVKAFDFMGSAYVSDIIAGIDWCVENDMDIINMSFGMRSYSKSLEGASHNALKAGIVVVASCGNEGKKASIDYPARFSQVVSVGAVTRTGKVAAFSNKGKRIDIYAPGEKIFSCWLNGKYNELSGTSMATAHVSGVVALMLSLKPELDPMVIKQTLKRNTVPLSKEKREGAPGYLNARRAVSAIMKK